MKKALLSLLSMLLFSAVTKHKTIVPLPQATALCGSSDTTFLLKEKDSLHYHTVFIEKNRHSRVYKNVLNFKMDDNDREEYLQNYQAIKMRSKKPFKKYNLADLPKEWLPLYGYKGSFYIYQPSEPGNMGRVTITDSTIMYWYMDGPAPQPLKDVNRLNNYTWQLRFHGYQQQDRDNTVIIHIIDQRTKMAVWEVVNAPVKYRYSLYVPRETAPKFDLVVNRCRENKEAEFNFDEIDYKALLKKTLSR